MAPRWQHAVVTGGAGFVGSHLCTALLAEGTAVTCVDDLCTGRAQNLAHLAGNPDFSVLRADVVEPFDIPRRADLVLHFASPASPADYLRLPLHTLETGSNGTRNALAIAREHGARFVLASTSEVYGDPHRHPQDESYWGNVNPVGPRSVYDEAKRYAEALTTAEAAVHGTDCGIVRLFNTYGPRMRGHDGRAVPTFIRQALAGEPLTVTGDGRQTRSLCYVDDTVRGILAMAASQLTGPVNIGNPDETTMLELARTIAALAGTQATIRFVERPVDDPAVRCPDIGLARDKLQWVPRVTAAEGLARTIAWFREHRGEYATA
ncbi:MULTISPECIES: NAD-dependent epimerase/dehydratase family protein [Streptomycetaceae]|uniref:Nucleotide-sugar dehydratase n=1 Tax=Streptantibioticus cattleyicolor (strain ATCC 35852 / DSM 46488 / JCM 4925 / NBRC 14057 / NRRL 8057) TaxID=1003195 RepID=F8K1J8_STREN|nr:MULTISPECIES: NAD-dependent epimerase/dehydratase family protein [Streptomycetaceae]AEW97502.1 nucleotide-sugar dehydratase [Streptantibioticus cattleyicolor NRRL 8057 = DSM 46488]MYS61935.1 NAD-dependent epimerase/dehydratase family protein [Streptomyces sp. SID5468]CCB77826.1 Nucleoside-diphosphate-sugar epimerase [Streptantibioticus cattleyicolor NRRL 8057 = DSM 46488]